MQRKTLSDAPSLFCKGLWVAVWLVSVRVCTECKRNLASTLSVGTLEMNSNEQPHHDKAKKNNYQRFILQSDIIVNVVNAAYTVIAIRDLPMAPRQVTLSLARTSLLWQRQTTSWLSSSSRLQLCVSQWLQFSCTLISHSPWLSMTGGSATGRQEQGGGEHRKEDKTTWMWWFHI